MERKSETAGGIDTGRLPQTGVALIQRLNAAGFEAWFVGGCVRDLLLGREPDDWDICTDARPEETAAVFSDCAVYGTGIKYGTVSVVTDGGVYEITTFRSEENYFDHRRPDEVCFVRSLSRDLARRDFTVNALALHPTRGLVDAFGGRRDLELGVIRTVGDPNARFGEDALRMMRALRFAGRFGFSVEADTAAAIRLHYEELSRIAAERLFAELKGILITPGAATLMLDYPEVFGAVVPDLIPTFGFDQNNPHHDADVWTHTARVVDGVPADPVLRLAALFHDVGKPVCAALDEKGITHFYGHGKISRDLAHQALCALKCDKATRERVELLTEIHGRELPQTPAAARRLLRKIGAENLRALLALQKADILAQSPLDREEKRKTVADFETLLAEVEAEEVCLSVKDLALTGGDLILLGIPRGPKVGQIQRKMLEAVLDGEVRNEKADLTEWLQKIEVL